MKVVRAGKGLQAIGHNLLAINHVMLCFLMQVV